MTRQNRLFTESTIMASMLSCMAMFGAAVTASADAQSCEDMLMAVSPKMSEVLKFKQREMN